MGAEFCSRRFASKFLFKLNNFWYATSESVKKIEGQGRKISEKKLIEDTENSLLLIDVHVKLECIFLQIFDGDPHFFITDSDSAYRK